MASFSERYHEYTKYNPETIDRLGEVSWDDQPEPHQTIENESNSIDLLPYLKFLEKGIEDIDWSIPYHADQPLQEIQNVASLLHFSAGLTGLMRTAQGSFYFRANPSAGGLYPNDLYIAIRNSQSIAEGIYYYHPVQSALHPVKNAKWKDLESSFPQNTNVSSSNTLILTTGVYHRSTWRYQERSYRRILLDNGHLVENILSLGKKRNLASCLINSFIDSRLEDLLNLKAEESFPLSAIAFPSKVHKESISSSLPPAEAVLNLPQKWQLQKQQNIVERIPAKMNFIAPKVIPEPQGKKVTLSHTPFVWNPNQLEITLLLRRSARELEAAPFPVSQFSQLLQYALSDTASLDLLPYLNIWVCPQNIIGIEPAVYKWHDGNLYHHGPAPAPEQIQEAALGQKLALDAQYTVLFTANLDQATSCYGDRSYRLLNHTAGIIGERLHILSEALNYGISGIGGYYDERCNSVFHLEPTEAILYMIVGGSKPQL